MFTAAKLEEARSKLEDVKILLDYLSFLRDNGLSDVGTGKLVGRAKLLNEMISDMTDSVEPGIKHESNGAPRENLEYDAANPFEREKVNDVVNPFQREKVNDVVNEPISLAPNAWANISDKIVTIPNLIHHGKRLGDEMLFRRRFFHLTHKMKMIRFTNNWQ